MRTGAVIALAIAWASPALGAPPEPEGDPFSSHAGTSGVLDVPEADALPAGAARMAAELRLLGQQGEATTAGPSYLSLGAGLGGGVEAGMALREGGRPGDPARSPLLFSASLKIRLLQASGSFPALALDLAATRLNLEPAAAARLVASTSLGRVRLLGAVGADAWRLAVPRRVGASLSLGALVPLKGRAEVAAEAVLGPQGAVAGAAVRWPFSKNLGVQAGVEYLPRTRGLAATVGLALASFPPPNPRAARAAAAAPEQPPEPVALAAPGFSDEVPRFRLHIRGTRWPFDERLDHYPVTGPLARTIPAPALGGSWPEESGPTLAELRQAREKEAREKIAAMREARARQRREREERLRLAKLEEPAAPQAPSGAAAPAPGPGAAAAPAVPAIAAVEAKPEPLVLEYGSSTSDLGPEEKKALEALARQAADESSELWIWAWVNADTLRLSEAAARAVQLKRELMRLGPVPRTRIVVQVSTRISEPALKVLVVPPEATEVCTIDPAGVRACAPLTPSVVVHHGTRSDLVRRAIDAVSLRFPYPAAALREGDRRALSRIVSRRGVQVQIWAQTGDDLDGLGEAANRALEVRQALLQTARILPADISVELTAEPRVFGVEVLVTSHEPELPGDRGGER